MKTPTKKSATHAKASRRAPRPVAGRGTKTAHRKPPQSVRARTHAAKTKKKVATMQKKRPTPVHARPRAAARPSGPRSGDSDRGLYVRFETPLVKADVMAYAEKAHISMNGFIVAATLKAKAEGWKPEMKPEAVADSEKDSKAEERKTA